MWQKIDNGRAKLSCTRESHGSFKLHVEYDGGMDKPDLDLELEIATKDLGPLLIDDGQTRDCRVTGTVETCDEKDDD